MEDRPEQSFFKDEALDRAVGMIMTLAAELYVTRDRLTVLERTLTARGLLEPNELDDYQPNSDTLLVDGADREAFTAALMANLCGKQSARGLTLQRNSKS